MVSSFESPFHTAPPKKINLSKQSANPNQKKTDTEQAQAFPQSSTIKRIQERIELINCHEEEIRTELKDLLKDDLEVQALVTNLCTIPSIGMLTSVTVLAETNGFELIRNKRQLASYADLDVKEKQSGTSIKGRPSITKRGNRYLRKAMYFPTLSAAKRIEAYKDTYARLISRHGIKMKAAVAIQRKLLELMYTLYKNKTVFNPETMNQSVNLAPTVAKN